MINLPEDPEIAKNFQFINDLERSIGEMETSNGFIPFNKLLKRNDSFEFYFWDSVHLTPKGSRWLAEYYAKAIINMEK